MPNTHRWRDSTVELRRVGVGGMNWKSCERILTKFLGGVGHGPGTNEFNFGDDPDHRPPRPDPGVRSPKSAFTGLSKKLPTDFHEILCRAGLRPSDQLITF